MLEMATGWRRSVKMLGNYVQKFEAFEIMELRTHALALEQIIGQLEF